MSSYGGFVRLRMAWHSMVWQLVGFCRCSLSVCYPLACEVLPHIGCCISCRRLDTDRVAAPIAKMAFKMDLASYAFKRCFFPSEAELVVPELLARDHVAYLEAHQDVGNLVSSSVQTCADMPEHTRMYQSTPEQYPRARQSIRYIAAIPGCPRAPQNTPEHPRAVYHPGSMVSL